MEPAQKVPVDWLHFVRIACWNIGGLLFGGVLIWGIVNWASAPRWQSVTGQMVFTEITTHTSRNSRGSNTTHTPRLNYRYNVGGRDYMSNRVRDGSISRNYMTQRGAQQIIDRYTNGPLIVYYDPADPQRAALDTSPLNDLLIYTGAFGLLLIIAGFVTTHRFARDDP